MKTRKNASERLDTPNPAKARRKTGDPLDISALIERMKLEVLPTEILKPYANNPRINDEAVEYVANSIRRFGFRSPIVVHGADNEIVNGHTRHRAALKIGLKRVPCLRADELTDQEIKALRLADNKTAEIAKWDEGLLDIEIASLPEFDLPEFGFGLESEENDETERFDGLDENGSAKTVEHAIRCGKIYIPMTDEEFSEFKAAFDMYVSDNGVSYGFVSHLLGATKAA